MTERRFWKLLLYIAVFCAAAFLLFRFLLPVLLPFGIGLALARLGEPAVDALETRGHFPRAAATGLVMGGLFLLLTLTLYLLSRTGAAELSRLAAKLPALLEGLRGPLAALRDRLLRLADRAPDGLGRALRDWTGRLFSGTSSLMERLSGGVLDLASGVVARVPGVFLFLVTTVVSSFMFSAERQKLAAWAGAHLPARWRAGGRGCAWGAGSAEATRGSQGLTGQGGRPDGGAAAPGRRRLRPRAARPPWRSGRRRSARRSAW